MEPDVLVRREESRHTGADDTDDVPKLQADKSVQEYHLFA